MSLLEEAKRVAAEFEYTDDEVRKGVKHFIHQMSTLPSLCASYYPVVRVEQWDNRLTSIADEGLAKNGSTMSQIPTYVTAVPNGTEKVRLLFPKLHSSQLT